MQRGELDQLATRTLDAAFEVHRELGPGLLENSYEMALCHELSRAGIRFERQKELPFHYKGVRLDCGYRIDVLVEGALLLELKSCEQLLPLHDSILLSYLKLARCSLGYLLNFKVKSSKTGFAECETIALCKTASPAVLAVSAVVKSL